MDEIKTKIKVRKLKTSIEKSMLLLGLFSKKVITKFKIPIALINKNPILKIPLATLNPFVLESNPKNNNAHRLRKVKIFIKF